MPLPQKVDVKKALKMKAQGMSYQDIASAQGVAKSTVFANLNPILTQLADPQTVEQYRKHQAEIIDGLAAATVASITNEKMANASFRDLCVGAGILIDKSRLIQGQSTSNSSIMLKAVLGSLGGENDDNGQNNAD
jgi:uncharacterized protein YerC